MNGRKQTAKNKEFRDMNCPRRQAAAVVTENNKIIVCGGTNSSNIAMSEMECFDPSSGVWTEFGRMPTPLRGHCAMFYGDKLVVMGGNDGNSSVSTVSVRKPDGTWYTSRSCLTEPCRLFTVALISGKILVIDGSSESGRPEYERIESVDPPKLYWELDLIPWRNTWWSNIPNLPYGCSQLSSIVIPKTLFANLE